MVKVKRQVTASTNEGREYHACQVSIDVAIPVDADVDLGEMIEDHIKELANNTGEFVFLGSDVVDMDEEYSDKVIKSFI